ncbi:hypothetical protein BGX26_001170 [Mortierella sp. AD094]|nr:hypothetical protein BGX26_001170 [Mortierella sp. AD094]
MFGHMTNLLITARSYMNVEPVRLHLSLKSLRRGVVEITTEEEDPTGIWVEDSGIPVCGTTVAIVNPETRELCLSREIGEIWVSSEANVQAYTPSISPLVVEADPVSANSIRDINASRFNATTVVTGASTNNSGSNSSIANTSTTNASNSSSGDIRSSGITYVRTGEVGFLWSYANENFNGGRATSLLFVLGSIGETFEVNGLMHFPMDVEATIEKAHPNIAPSGSIVFQTDQAVVCVIQVRRLDSAIVNLTLSVMHQVLDKHQFMPDVIAIVGEDVLAKNRYGEKQRLYSISIILVGHCRSRCQSRCILMTNRREFWRQWSTNPLKRVLAARRQQAGMPPSPSSASTAGAATTTGVSGKKKPGSVRSSRSAISIAGSIGSLRSVKSFVGSIFNSSKKNQLQPSKSASASTSSIATSTTTDLKGIHGSKSESGLETLSEITSPVEPLPKLNTSFSVHSMNTKSYAEGALKTPVSAQSTSSSQSSSLLAKRELPTVDNTKKASPISPLSPISS